MITSLHHHALKLPLMIKMILDNTYPITDEEGKILTPYTFTITSLCESNAKYQINLEVLNNTTLEDMSILKD